MTVRFGCVFVEATIVEKQEAQGVASSSADAASFTSAVKVASACCYSEVKILSIVINKHLGESIKIQVLTQIHPVALASINSPHSTQLFL